MVGRENEIENNPTHKKDKFSIDLLHWSFNVNLVMPQGVSLMFLAGRKLDLTGGQNVLN